MNASSPLLPTTSPAFVVDRLPTPTNFGLKIIFEGCFPTKQISLQRLEQRNITPISENVCTKDSVDTGLSVVLALVDHLPDLTEIRQRLFPNDPEFRQKTLELGYLILNEYTTRGIAPAHFLLFLLCKKYLSEPSHIFSGIEEKKFYVCRDYTTLLANGNRTVFKDIILKTYPGITKQVNEIFENHPPS